MHWTLGSFYRAFQPLAGSDVSKIFDSNSLPVVLGFFDNMFRYDMVCVFPESCFTPRKFLEMALSRLGTAFLKIGAKPLHALAVLFDCLAAECFALRVNGNINYAQIDSRSEEHTSELQSPCNLVCR